MACEMHSPSRRPFFKINCSRYLSVQILIELESYVQVIKISAIVTLTKRNKIKMINLLLFFIINDDISLVKYTLPEYFKVH